jgi:hypothetical protein
MKILESNWDEFNSYPSVNFYYNHFKEEPHVVIFEGYECLYPLIKNKIIVERPKEIHKLSCTDRDAIIKNKILNLVSEEDIITNRRCIDEIHPDRHLYKFLFSSYTKYMIENKKHLFESPQKNIDETKKILNRNKPIVCINGRNLKKLPGYNNNLEDLIKILIENKIFVINCTFDKPNFLFDPEYYWEPGELIESYNMNCSLFSLCDYVISIGNAGSISTHLMTNSNVIILGPGGWVDDINMGYNGESMITARQKYLPYKTIFIKNYKNNATEGNKQILKTILG